LGVEYFFVLSGVVIYLAHEKDIQNPSRFGQYVVKRFRRIYPMYWLVLIPLVAQYLLRPHVGADYQRNEWVIASGIALVHVRSLEVNLPVAWSLFHEVLFYGFFALLIWKRRSGSVALVLWLAASVYFLVWHGNQYLSSYLFSPLHLLFGMGMLAAWILRHKTVPFPGFAAMVGLGMFGSSIVLAMGNDFPVWVSILSGAGATFVILGTSALERKGRIWIPEFLVFLGGASYSIYLLHYPFLMFAMPAIYRVSVRFHATVWMAMAVIVVLGTAAGCAFHMWVERPMLKRLETINLSAVLPTGATAIFSYLRRIAEIGLLPGFGRASSQPRRDDGM
jgi:peptidoglycan/LPS O-acetylase OafA/YrhL